MATPFDFRAYGAVLRLRATKRCDFPSEAHELAWEIAEYFSEPYAFWVRRVKSARWHVGRVRHEFEVLKAKPKFTRVQKVRMLMETLKPKGKR